MPTHKVILKDKAEVSLWESIIKEGERRKKIIEEITEFSEYFSHFDLSLISTPNLEKILKAIKKIKRMFSDFEMESFNKCNRN